MSVLVMSKVSIKYPDNPAHRCQNWEPISAFQTDMILLRNLLKSASKLPLSYQKRNARHTHRSKEGRWVKLSYPYYDNFQKHLETYLSALLTHSMEQSPSWEANWFCSQSRNAPHFMEQPESSLPYSKAPATCPCPQPTPSSPHNPFPLPQDPS